MIMHDCVFCEYVERLDEFKPGEGIGGGLLLRESRGVMFIQPPEPVVKGHFLFVPKRHVEHPHSDPLTSSHLFGVASNWIFHWGHDSYNLIVSSGKPATQTVPHMHVHYVPRHKDDGLRLPWGPH